MGESPVELARVRDDSCCRVENTLQLVGFLLRSANLVSYITKSEAKLLSHLLSCSNCFRIFYILFPFIFLFRPFAVFRCVAIQLLALQTKNYCNKINILYSHCVELRMLDPNQRCSRIWWNSSQLQNAGRMSHSLCQQQDVCCCRLGSKQHWEILLDSNVNRNRKYYGNRCC